MKYHRVGGIVALALCLGPVAAHADSDLDQETRLPEGAEGYARFGIGPSWSEDGVLKQFGGPANNTVQYDASAAVDIALGYSFNRYFAADFEMGAVGTNIKSVSAMGS